VKQHGRKPYDREQCAERRAARDGVTRRGSRPGDLEADGNRGQTREKCAGRERRFVTRSRKLRQKPEQ